MSIFLLGQDRRRIIKSDENTQDNQKGVIYSFERSNDRSNNYFRQLGKNVELNIAHTGVHQCYYYHHTPLLGKIYQHHIIIKSNCDIVVLVIVHILLSAHFHFIVRV